MTLTGKIYIALVILMLILWGQSYYEIIILILTMFFHEMGHIMAINFYNIKCNKINIFTFGAEINIQYDELSKKEKIIINLAGPITNLIIAMLFVFWSENRYIKEIVYINLLIGIFNLIPIIPLDGSKIIEVLLQNRFGTISSKKTVITISKVLANFFILAGIIQLIKTRYNFNLFFIGMYMIYKLKKENSMYRLNGINRILNRKQRFFKKGIYTIRHIAVLKDKNVYEVIKELDFDSIHIVNVLDEKMEIIATLNEDEIIQKLVEGNTNITFNDFISDIKIQG